MNSQSETQWHDGNGKYADGGNPTEVYRESPLQEHLAILLRGRWTILVTLLVVAGLVAYYTFVTKPVYEASCLVLIDTKSNEGTTTLLDLTGTASVYKITNELEILKSEGHAYAVARALLVRRYLNDHNTETIPIIQSGKEGVPQDSLADVSVVMRRVSTAMEFVPIKESDLIRINVHSTEPEEAALIANVCAEVYTSRNLSASRLREKSVREFLEGQFHSKRTVLDSAENVLQNYMKRSGVVSLDAGSNTVVTQLSQLESQRDALLVEQTSRKKVLASYKEELASQEPKAALAMGESNDSYIRMLQEQLAKLEVQRDVVIAQNPEVVNAKLYAEKLGEINAQITTLKKTLTERTQAFLNSQLPGRRSPGDGNASFLGEVKQKIIEQQIELSGIDARIKTLNSVIDDYEKKFDAIPQKSIELAKLQRARLSSEKLYLLVEEKYNESAIKEKSQFGYVHVVDPALVPTDPVSPKVARNLVLGFLLGLGLGVGIVFVRASGDTRIRTPLDLKRYGYVPLSTVGLMDSEVKNLENELAGLGVHNRFDSHLIAHHRPMAPIAESYRYLRTNIQHLQVDAPLRCFVVASANPREGKTTTAANLAISFSQAEKKVLLVDADMRRPGIHTAFGLKNSAGLNDHLFGKSTIDEVTKKSVLPNLDIIVSGTSCPNPAEVLGSKKMKDFVAQVKQRYDLVLFDSPPFLAVMDVAVLAAETDGVLLVVAAGTTSATGLEHVAESLAGIGVKLIGVVLNKFDIREVYGSDYAGYRYGYYGYESGYYRKDGEEKKTKKSLVQSLTAHK